MLAQPILMIVSLLSVLEMAAGDIRLSVLQEKKNYLAALKT
jgi:hypothetical protein